MNNYMTSLTLTPQGVIVSYPVDLINPVLVRLTEDKTELEFLNSNDEEKFEGVEDPDNWEVLDKCSPEDLEDTQEIVKLLGGDVSLVCAGFPNIPDSGYY